MAIAVAKAFITGGDQATAVANALAVAISNYGCVLGSLTPLS